MLRFPNDASAREFDCALVSGVDQRSDDGIAADDRLPLAPGEKAVYGIAKSSDVGSAPGVSGIEEVPEFAEIEELLEGGEFAEIDEFVERAEVAAAEPRDAFESLQFPLLSAVDLSEVDEDTDVAGVPDQSMDGDWFGELVDVDVDAQQLRRAAQINSQIFLSHELQQDHSAQLDQKLFSDDPSFWKELDW